MSFILNFMEIDDYGVSRLALYSSKEAWKWAQVSPVVSYKIWTV